MAVYRAELEAAGKGAPRELPVVKEVYCAKDRATALEMAGPYLLAKYRDYAKWGQDKVMPDDTDFNRPLEELIKAAVHPWLARGLLRRAQALLGRVWRQSHHHPHALGGDAIIHLTREHASDLERATACAAGSLARRPAWLRASLSILASAEPHPERKSALNRAKVSTNGVVTSQTDRAEHRLFGGSSSRHSLRRASGGHRARKPHAKHRSWQRVSWQPWAINRNL